MSQHSSVLELAGHRKLGLQEFLTFTLGHEEYGMDILKVQEIRGYDHVTQIANAPDFIKGVINLRGVIVPILDMRIRFNLSKGEYNEFTIVIILSLNHGRVIGMVVDAVSDVVSLIPDQIKAPPAFNASVLKTDYILGLADIEERMVILVDVERLMLEDEMGLVDQQQEQLLKVAV
jgi:purine-binding chemotaxis protein CheW